MFCLIHFGNTVDELFSRETEIEKERGRDIWLEKPVEIQLFSEICKMEKELGRKSKSERGRKRSDKKMHELEINATTRLQSLLVQTMVFRFVPFPFEYMNGMSAICGKFMFYSFNISK